MPREIDAHDRLLLDLLARDARTSTSDLAAYIGETPENVLDRISRLSEAGHIGGYRAIRGYPDPDEQPAIALLFVQRDPAMSGKDVLRSLRSLPELLSCDVADGGFDLIVRIQAGTRERVDEIESFFLNQVGVETVTVVRPLSSVDR